MASHTRPSRAKFLSLLLCIPLLILAACGTPSTTGGSGSKGTITVGSKLDVESQLIAKMYTLLLQKAGYTVNEKAALGNSIFILNAIKSNAIDLYPEFTTTGLNALNMSSSYNPQKDYQTVKDGFNKQFQITWLDPSPLNDGYALCTSKEESQKLGITTLSQVAAKVGSLSLVSPSDGVAFVDGLKKTYGFDTKSFKQAQTIDYALGFTAVASNKAEIAVCYTTDGTVTQKNFIFLQDDKNGFPAFNPAPIVRNAVLAKYPDIPTILNPLAPKLTTDVSVQLQKEVADKKSAGMPVSQAVTEVATSFLKSQGLD